MWQSMGGQEVGSIWGHGAYVAPDWSADWLHREATWLLDLWAVAAGVLALGWFILGLKTGWSLTGEADVAVSEPAGDQWTRVWEGS